MAFERYSQTMKILSIRKHVSISAAAQEPGKYSFIYIFSLRTLIKIGLFHRILEVAAKFPHVSCTAVDLVPLPALYVLSLLLGIMRVLIALIYQ